MASRKEEKEALRKAREEAEREEMKGQRRQLLVGYGVAGILVAAVLAGIVVVILGSGDGSSSEGGEFTGVDTLTGVTTTPDGEDLKLDDREGAEIAAQETIGLEESARAANCELNLDLKDEGNVHLPDDSDVPDYETNPPSSGDHLVNPLADGAYLDTPSPLNYVHSLEHGRIQIQYQPDLSDEAQLELKGLFLESVDGMIMFPNPDLDVEVAAAAWQNTITCETYEGAATLDALRSFRDQFRGQGPEAIPL